MGVEFDIRGEHPDSGARPASPGKFNVYNARAAAAVTLWVGVPAEKLQHALEHLKINGRMEIVYTSEKCCGHRRLRPQRSQHGEPSGNA